MTPERFGELLRRPQLLSGQNATELEELIAAHPWCGHLRMLRYRKAVVEDADDVDYWRARAEPFLFNATLYSEEALLRNARPTRAEIHFAFDTDAEADGTDVLAGGEAEAGHELGSGRAREHDSDNAEDSTAAELLIDVADIAQHENGMAFAYESPEDESEVEPFDLEGCIQDAGACVMTADWYMKRNGLIMEYGRPKPAPIEHLESYRVWKQRRAQTSWNDLLQLGIAPPKDKKRRADPKPKAEAIVPEVASETLADLLGAQGHVDKAVRMYEQLSLRYPAKKASFAARIQALLTQQQQEA